MQAVLSLCHQVKYSYGKPSYRCWSFPLNPDFNDHPRPDFLFSSAQGKMHSCSIPMSKLFLKCPQILQWNAVPQLSGDLFSSAVTSHFDFVIIAILSPPPSQILLLSTTADVQTTSLVHIALFSPPPRHLPINCYSGPSIATRYKIRTKNIKYCQVATS